MNTNKTWKTVSSHILQNTPHLQLLKDQVESPDGQIFPYYVVERPDFSVVIPLGEKNMTYLIGQYRYAMKSYSWEFPMGSVLGKTPLEMAKQELLEEAGIEAKNWQPIGKFYVANGFLKQTAFVFVARGLNQKTSQPEQHEFLDIKEVPLTSVDTMINQGEILDGITICAFHLLEVYLSKIQSSNIKIQK